MFSSRLGFLSVLSRFNIRQCATAAMQRRLEGKVAVVTGSTDGIGYAIARRLGQDGAKVVVSSRRQKNVTKAVAQLQAENITAHGVVCHVGKKEHRQNLVEQAVATFGGIDILVANAGINPAFGPMLDVSEDAWDKVFDINVKSTFMMCQEAVPSIEKRGGGAVLVVSSIGGLDPDPMIGPYSVTKTALLGLVKALAKELVAKNIRINSICPGIIKTNFSGALTSNEHISDQLMSTIPLKRFGTPEDCAGMASLLVSDDSSYITGENIAITGGMPSRL